MGPSEWAMNLVRKLYRSRLRGLASAPPSETDIAYAFDEVRREERERAARIAERFPDSSGYGFQIATAIRSGADPDAD